MSFLSLSLRVGVICALAAAIGAPTPENPTVDIQIDATAARHPISPLIYGVCFGTTDQLKALNAPLNRQGGNGATNYNWKINASNHASDWFYESIGEKSDVPGESGDTFIAQSKAGGAQPMLTIPTIGWVAKLGPDRAKLSSYPVSQYGPQQKTDPYMADAGNGIKPDGTTEILNTRPENADVPSDSAYQQGWVKHIVSRWGKASGSGLRYYLLDNEPSIWQSTHRDVHPQGPTMEEMRDKILDYGTKIKAVDPSALVIAPEEWGWNGYIYSGADQQFGSEHHQWHDQPDRVKHGNMDYLPWLLDQLHKENQKTGHRILDVFSVHYYPQSGEFNGDASQDMQLRRNRSTRSLWDTSYTDESWIHDKVALIPRLKKWVATYYPGTKTGITEYNWGAEDNINGATTQADIFGIFGREGLDIATRWTTPDAKTPTFKAMQMYRNYDGHNAGFGDLSVSDSVPNPDYLSSFAAIRHSDGALTVMVINKSLSGDTPVTVDLSHFAGNNMAQVWQLTSANTINHLPDITLRGKPLHTVVPAQSITLYIFPAAQSTH